MQHALPNKLSTSCPIVMRDGSACGLIIKSGLTPSAVNGISSSGIMRPIVPFCPAREAILSPIAGTRSSRILILAILNPSSPSLIKALSTIPNCPFLVVFDLSMYEPFCSVFVVTSPIKTTRSSIGVFSFTNPY